MKKSFDRARMKFMRKPRKDWNPAKGELAKLNCSQALDYFASEGEFFDVNELRCYVAKVLPPLEPQDYED